MVADKLSRLGQIIQTEWSLHPQIFQTICDTWHQPQIDLFARRYNKLAQFVSPVPDPQAWAVYALSLSWENLDPYAFPPTAILGKVVEKLENKLCRRLILIAPGWPNMHWFWELSDHVQSNSTEPAQTANTALQSDPSQKSDKSESPCLAPRASAIQEQSSSSGTKN